MKISSLFLCILSVSHCAVLPSIPAHLLACYRFGGPAMTAPRRLDVLLSLLAKLELHSKLNMRMFTTALLRSLRLDGIEQAANVVESDIVLPWRASAFQFHKYKLLMDLFLPSQDLLQVDEILSLEEKCLLHRMLSSAVRQWERGDENIVCPVSAEQRQSMSTEGNTRIHSRCPIEDGVIQTEWGTVSPGTVIAAIASSLEAQTVSINDILNTDVFKEDVAEPLMASAKQEWVDNIETLDEAVESQRLTSNAEISNVWVATLAGDLSEVVTNQGPRVGAAPQRMAVGSNNRWNDTLLPRDLYLLTQNAASIDWHLTDAEILAGIDGLILSQYIPKWVQERQSLRLAQVLDMYYSNEGVSFDSSVKACNRQALFGQIFNSSDLLSETTRFAHILSLRQITVYIPVEDMERISNAAVTAFVNYVPSILRANSRSCEISPNVPTMDLIVATDGAWKGYDVQQFMSWVGGALELNMARSTVALMHGNTGLWIVPPADILTTVFAHIHNFTDEWPNRLNLPNVISSVIQHSMNKSLQEAETGASAGASTVVLIVSPSDTPSGQELERSRVLMNSLRTSFFDVYFAYVSRDLTPFQNINNEYMDYSELFLTAPTSNVQDVIDAVDTYLVKSEIPTRIFGPHCPVNGTLYPQTEYEDFVLPERARSYRIHPYYMRQQPAITVKFRNTGQGSVLVCMWRGAETSHACQKLAEREAHIFNLTMPCDSPDFCPPAHFNLAPVNTANLCANDECRLPHQVGYYLQHTGLKCLAFRNHSSYKSLENYLFLTLMISYYLIFFII